MHADNGFHAQAGRVVRVEVVHPRCAGIDISKKDAKVCVRVQGSGRRATKSTVTTWGAMSNEILALREHLIAEKVTCVVMESTGDYWKPFYYLLEDVFNVMLVNPRDARNRPGRKTDVSDAAWIADLGAHGLLRASLVPPPPIRRLRDLTRARTDLTRDRTRQVNRLEKILEDAGIKLSSVATDIMGASGRAMLEALIEGKAWSTTVAEIFLAETGGDMGVFPSPGHLASWAGVCPGANESAGRVKSTKTRDGNRNLKALSASPPWPLPAPRTPTSPPSIGASVQDADR